MGIVQEFTPRFDVLAEQLVIGKIMQDQSFIVRCELGGVHSEHFYRDDHRAIYAAATKLFGEFNQITPELLAESFDGDLKDVIEQYLRDIKQNTSDQTPEAFDIAVKSIRKWKLVRGLVERSADLASAAIEGDYDEVDAALDDLDIIRFKMKECA